MKYSKINIKLYHLYLDDFFVVIIIISVQILKHKKTIEKAFKIKKK